MSDYQISSTSDSEEQITAAAGVIKEEPKEPETKNPEVVSEEDAEENSSEEAPEVIKPRKGGFQKRIDKLTREKDELKARLEKLEAAATPATVEVDAGPPDPEFFATQAEYIQALVKYETAAQRKAAAEETKQEETKKAADAIVSTWQTRVSAAHEAHPDLAELLEQDLPISPAVNEALLESEVGGELLYYFASKPEELSRVSALNPIAAIKAVALIEKSLGKAPEAEEAKPTAVVKVTSVKKPISPITSGKGAPVAKNPDDMSMEEYRRWREANS